MSMAKDDKPKKETHAKGKNARKENGRDSLESDSEGNIGGNNLDNKTADDEAELSGQAVLKFCDRLQIR